MEKKRARVITGWREVVRRKPPLSGRRRLAFPLQLPVPSPRGNITQAAANERWEAEGGNLAGPVKK